MTTLNFITSFIVLSHCLFCHSFHDCIEAAARVRNERRSRRIREIVGFLNEKNSNNQTITASTVSSHSSSSSSPPPPPPCSGGICVGMKNGPHEGGNASYPVAWNGKSATFINVTMTVPTLPYKTTNITYYIWTDIFFGDGLYGRMNQFVPQLLLGDVLDSSTGPPYYKPKFHHHDTWVFGSHYFWELYNTTTTKTTSHAAYGQLFPTWPGEVLYTSFELKVANNNNNHEEKGMSTSPPPPKWILTMGVVGDDSRVSELVISHSDWEHQPSTSWLEEPYHNMCINSCWELSGATDNDHLPTSGSRYEITIHQPTTNNNNNTFFNFISSWEQDEGNGICPSCTVQESHTNQDQSIIIDIDV